MKYHIYSIAFFFSLLVSGTSYCQTSTHADDLLYYTTIALQMKEITPKVQSFWGELRQSIMTATENGNHKLDESKISNLKDDLRNNENELDRKIRMIGSLDETDKDLNLKQIIITYLTEAKSLEENSVPKVIQFLDKGIDKLNEQEKQVLKLFIMKGEELSSKSRNLQSISMAYRGKHNITNAELDKYGL